MVLWLSKGGILVAKGSDIFSFSFGRRVVSEGNLHPCSMIFSMIWIRVVIML